MCKSIYYKELLFKRVKNDFFLLKKMFHADCFMRLFPQVIYKLSTFPQQFVFHIFLFHAEKNLKAG